VHVAVSPGVIGITLVQIVDYGEHLRVSLSIGAMAQTLLMGWVFLPDPTHGDETRSADAETSEELA